MVMTMSVIVVAHGAVFVIVQRSVMGPVPPVWVKVALGVVLSGLKVPVPPPTTLHAPVPTVGVLPPRSLVVPRSQIVCGPPTVAVVGAVIMLRLKVVLATAQVSVAGRV